MAQPPQQQAPTSQPTSPEITGDEHVLLTYFVIFSMGFSVFLSYEMSRATGDEFLYRFLDTIGFVGTDLASFLLIGTNFATMFYGAWYYLGLRDIHVAISRIVGFGLWIFAILQGFFPSFNEEGNRIFGIEEFSFIAACVSSFVIVVLFLILDTFIMRHTSDMEKKATRAFSIYYVSIPCFVSVIIIGAVYFALNLGELTVENRAELRMLLASGFAFVLLMSNILFGFINCSAYASELAFKMTKSDDRYSA